MSNIFLPESIILINKAVGESGKLLSANNLLSAFSSLEYYDTDQEKVASITRSVMQNHPFVDGNKRTGCVYLISALETIGITVVKTDEEIIAFAVDSVIERWGVNRILVWSLEK